jgi:hypothetical protein
MSPAVVSTKKMKYIVGPDTRCYYRVLVASLRCKLTSHQRCSEHSVHNNGACSVLNRKFVCTIHSFMLTHLSILPSTSTMKTHKQLSATQAFPSFDLTSQLDRPWELLIYRFCQPGMSRCACRIAIQSLSQALAILGIMDTLSASRTMQKSVMLTASLT